MRAVLVLVGHHEVVRDLACLLVLDDALEQELTVDLARQISARLARYARAAKG